MVDEGGRTLETGEDLKGNLERPHPPTGQSASGGTLEKVAWYT